MGQAVSTEILDDIAVIRIDNPPVNALSNEVIAGLHAEWRGPRPTPPPVAS